MNADDLTRDLARAFPDDPGRPAPAARPAGRRGRSATASSTSPTGPSTPRSARCCWPPPSAAWSGSPTPARTTTPSCRPWPTGSAPASCSAPARLDAAARELDEYFAGRRRAFDLPLDWRLSAGFRRAVLSHLPEIGYGHTASYAAVAQLAGNPQGGPRRRHRLRDQPAAGRRALPPGHPRGRRASAATSAAPTPSAPCSPWRPPHEPHRDRAPLRHRRHARPRAGPGRRPPTGTAVRAELDGYGCAPDRAAAHAGRGRARSPRCTATTPGSGRPSTWPGTGSARASTATSPSRSRRPSPS